MTCIDGPVCLKQSEADNVYSGHLLFYDVVPPSVVCRSGFLASISEAGGDARLPNFVTLSEFKAWIKATSRDSCSETDLGGACIVLKVADALDDKRYAEWLKVTANILLEHALALRDTSADTPSPTEASDSQRIADGFTQLPEHLQCRVFEAASCIQKGEHVGLLLDLLPEQYHAAILATAVNPDKSLSTPPNTRPLPFLRSLSTLPASPPSLLSLSLYFEDKFWLSEGRKPDHNPLTRQSPGPLATSLRHHSGLTSLRHDHFGNKDSMRALAPAISTLTSLQALSLGRIGHITAASLPYLKMSLCTLTCLQHLEVSIALVTEELQAGQCRGDKAVLYCLADVLSPVTALTSLDITGICVWEHLQLTCEVPLNLPCLKQFKTESQQHHFASTILRQLSAPLSALSVTCPPLANLRQLDLPLPMAMWTSLQKFAHLRSLDVGLIIAYEDSQRRADAVAGAPAAIAALTCLEELKITSSYQTLLRVVQQLTWHNHQPGLRRLCVDCTGRYDGGQSWMPRVAPVPAPVVPAPDVLMHIGNLNLLQHFDCFGSSWGPHHQPADFAALQPIVGLTALHARRWQRCLDSPAGWQVLAGMRQLRSVCLEHLVVAPAAQAACVRALGALPGLTRLALSPTYDQAEHLFTAFVEHAPGAAWPALQWLGLFELSPSDAEAVLRAVVAFPAGCVLKEVMLGDPAALAPLDDDKGLRYPEHFEGPLRDRLKGIAGDAGLTLELNVDWSSFKWKSSWM